MKSALVQTFLLQGCDGIEINFNARKKNDSCPVTFSKFQTKYIKILQCPILYRSRTIIVLYAGINNVSATKPTQIILRTIVFRVYFRTSISALNSDIITSIILFYDIEVCTIYGL